MLRKSVTQQYPEVKPVLPPRSRGVIALVEENCTSCMLCARECPDWCIYIDSHKETIPAPEGGRPRQRNVLDRFAIDFSLCMYCGICIEVCPFDALFWSPEFEYADGDIRNLLHEKDKLATWAPTVPPPPAHDPGAEPPKELTAARRPPARTGKPAAQKAAPGETPPAGGPARPSRPSTAKPSPPEPDQATDAAEPNPTTGTAGSDQVAGSAQPNSTTGVAGPDQVAGTTEPNLATGVAGPDQATGTAQPKPTTGTRRPDLTTGAAEPKPTPSATEPPSTPGASIAEPTKDAPGEGPSPTPTGRPRRTMANVRGIRPPGALPSRPRPDARTPEPPEGGTPPPAGGDKSSTQSQTDTSDDNSPATTEETDDPSRPTPPDKGTGPSEQQPRDPASSTGRPPPEELPTASGQPQPAPDPEEQTSPASPRRRRMADPRSIRPPGRLGPDETRESEEES
ncbi:4Fe-4S binding protein [Nonomuraea sp. NPDC046802]|uniref:NuoI/complex I 23 kDa subunit family protein n=1 Tax=Nonomuraea sp. NPDC046802 TaxID=3154919 RepID=UPI0033FC0514